MTQTHVRSDTVVRGGVGSSALRPDGIPKLTGDFAFLSDLHADGMLWGATLRSPHAHARITHLDVTPALAMRGVHAALTIADVPGARTFGLEEDDQPVLTDGVARYHGEPVAVVAADDHETARRAVDAIEVEFEPLPVASDAEAAVAAGELFRHVVVRRGDPDARGEIAVEGTYEVGSQDQAPLGTEAGLAIPDGHGGIDLYAPSQWVHADHRQIVPCLALDDDQLRVHPGGLGGAFGAREDLCLQIHACLLAQRTGRPVKMVYSRSESFTGHVHRHPARMWFRHEADRDGRLVAVRARLVLDGGAYASTSSAVVGNASYFAVGPYRVDNVSVDGYAARTNNPPCGAMRGFGAVQACFGHESQMDRLATALGLDPLELRLRNALGPGEPFPTTGQEVPPPLPTVAVIRSVRSLPLPDPEESDDPRRLPGGTGLTTPRSAVRRGVGYAVSIKNLGFSEGFDDYADARAVLTPAGVEIHTAAVEVGQGMTVLLQQIARSVLGIEAVAVVAKDTAAIGSAGSTSASRQTQLTGGAVHDACVQLRERLLERTGADQLDDRGALRGGAVVATLEELCADGTVDAEVRFRHPATTSADDHGQGTLHADFAVAAHRAVVEVDPELGLVRVVAVDTAQDVGRALNPGSVLGQIEGGIMQGVGLAIMEELIVREGEIVNASFTDYLLPTFADAPSVEAVLIEEPSSWGPFGAKGVGEPPTISSTAAVVAAIRDATGLPLDRTPVRPDDLVAALRPEPAPG